MRGREFVQDLHLRKDTDLLVLACSKKKRHDLEIDSLLDVRPSNLLPHAEAYRDCTSKLHDNSVDPCSEPRPSFFRYRGTFYDQVPVCLWKEVQRWPVLIVSAYYGLVRPLDGIRNYDLALF